jgi:uncharacterized damage-inducible protein DinB
MLNQEFVRFADAVRYSTIRRLKAVPAGKENWGISKNAMSFADMAHHLLACDNWLFEKLHNENLQPIRGCKGEGETSDHEEYTRLIEKLIDSGKRRSMLIQKYSDDDMKREIHDSRFGGKVSIWWVIVRGNLDHEIHHRGQIAAYLRLLGDVTGNSI